jgi:Lysyl oxidase
MRRLILAATTAIAVTLFAFAFTAFAGGKPPATTGLLPDMRTVVPTHLQLVNQQQRETLRFSNGIANTGPGPWALRPDRPLTNEQTVVGAIQEFRDSNAALNCADAPPPCYNVVSERLAGVFEYHPAHNHWHIGSVALFEVRRGSPTGPVVGGNSIKTTFCLIDWYKLDDNSPASERTFFDCYHAHQGIQSGWVDQYHQSTEGQQLDLTGVPNRNDYYLVSTANPDGIFTEATRDNNTAWVKFRLSAASNGNRKVEVTDHSPCSSPGLCGERSTNR